MSIKNMLLDNKKETVLDTAKDFPQPNIAFKLAMAFPGLLVFKCIRKWVEKYLPNAKILE